MLSIPPHLFFSPPSPLLPGPYSVARLTTHTLFSDPFIPCRQFPLPFRPIPDIILLASNPDSCQQIPYATINVYPSFSFLPFSQPHALLMPIGSRFHPSITHACTHTYLPHLHPSSSYLSAFVIDRMRIHPLLPTFHPLALTGTNHPYILPAFLKPIGLHERCRPPYTHRTSLALFTSVWVYLHENLYSTTYIYQLKLFPLSSLFLLLAS